MAGNVTISETMSVEALRYLLEQQRPLTTLLEDGADRCAIGS
jgi:hypothetical protein